MKTGANSGDKNEPESFYSRGIAYNWSMEIPDQVKVCPRFPCIDTGRI